jgi:hypothetical protein
VRPVNETFPAETRDLISRLTMPFPVTFSEPLFPSAMLVFPNDVCPVTVAEFRVPSPLVANVDSVVPPVIPNKPPTSTFPVA